MLTRRTQKILAMLGLVCFSQTACYNTYIIDTNELKKLEDSIEQKEIVMVYADCPASSAPAAPAAATYRSLDGTMWAQATPAGAGAETATDALPAVVMTKTEGAGRPGCTEVPVSTANTLQVVTTSDERKRVTPFNFFMSDTQLVSPEYDLLQPLNTIQGAEVREVSTGKTIAFVAGVALVTIGAFVGISVLAGEETGFK